MIQTSNEYITTVKADVILNPITVEGYFMITSMVREYPRCLRCMRSIAQQDLITIGKTYNYHEITTYPKPESLINICCALQPSGEIQLNGLEKTLFVIATNFASNKYVFKTLSIPDPKFWTKDHSVEMLIRDLMDRYFKNLKKIKIKYYYA